MSSRPLMIATLIGASVGVPYVMSHSSTNQNGANNASPPAMNASLPGEIALKPPALAQRLPAPGQNPGSPAYANPAPVQGARFTSVNQVLRFDVTKEWVYRSWDRKSTGPTDVGLFSVRVPLAMSSPMTGLAGSLTYFFNSQGQVEHISFRGRTGDTTQLVQLLTRYYQFQRVESPTGEQVYQVRSGDQVQSELRTRPEAVLWSNSPNQSIAVELEFARPGSHRVLPPRPTGLQIPQVAAQPTATPPQATEPTSTSSTTEKVTTAVKSATSSYFGKVRYATPTEEDQVLWKRWPN